MSHMSAIRFTTKLKSALGISLLLACLTVMGGSFRTDTAHQTGTVAATQSLPGVVALALDAASSPVVFSHAIVARDALGFPVGVRRSGKHVQDKFQNLEYDEVDELEDADTADIFTEVSRGIDKWLWFVEAHSQAAN